MTAVVELQHTKQCSALRRWASWNSRGSGVLLAIGMAMGVAAGYANAMAVKHVGTSRGKPRLTSALTESRVLSSLYSPSLAEPSPKASAFTTRSKSPVLAA